MGTEKKQAKKGLSRRTFIKQTLIGGVAVASSAGLSRLMASSDVPLYPQMMYLDEAAADKTLMEKKYVLMSEEEKEKMVQMFIDNYYKNPA